MTERVFVKMKPKDILAATSSLLYQVSPHDLWELSEQEHIDYVTLMILAGHLQRLRNGKTNIR